MPSRTSDRRLVASAALFLVLGLIALWPSIVRADGPASEPAAASFETEFLTSMIDHHRMANEMAMVCQGKDERADLEQLCGEIIAAQSQEIEEMQSWLQDWYGETHEPTMMAADTAMLDMLNALSGDEFEAEFMTMMIEHHSTAIERAEECLESAEHEELVALCENIIASQRAEIQQMQSWLQEGRTASPSPMATATVRPGTATPFAPTTGTGSRTSGGRVGAEVWLVLAGVALIVPAVAVAISGRRKL